MVGGIKPIEFSENFWLLDWAIRWILLIAHYRRKTHAFKGLHYGIEKTSFPRLKKENWGHLLCILVLNRRIFYRLRQTQILFWLKNRLNTYKK